jgi:hypothetical protein
MAPLRTVRFRTGFPAEVQRRLQVAYAAAWEAQVETHKAEAVRFVDSLAPLVTVDQALESYFREVPVPMAMRDVVRAGVFVRLDFVRLDAPVGDAHPDGWRLLWPGTLIGITRQLARNAAEARQRAGLAGARALEALSATHLHQALEVERVLRTHASPEEALAHYIRTMDLPPHQAQIVFQQALAAVAERELAEQATEAQPDEVLMPVVGRDRLIRLWAS